MTFRDILRLPLTHPAPRLKLMGLGWCLAIAAMAFPYDHDKHVLHNPPATALAVEHVGRHLNTLMQVSMPLLMRDWVGLKQLLVVAATATGTVHGLKHLLNDVEIAGSRLGQRPHSASSKHNMPSGHSSLATSGAWFVARRYGLIFLWILAPMAFMTMWTRVMLDAHTIWATVAGALLGILLTDLFTTARHKRARPACPTAHR